MKKGFTLAEVLITLGIIGVVAALTIPSLVTDYKEKQRVTQLKKVYSTLNQALQFAIIEYGKPSTWGIGNTVIGTNEDGTKKYDFSSMEMITDRLSKYMRVAKRPKIGDNNPDCKVGAVSYNLNKTQKFITEKCTPVDTTAYVVLQDGTMIFFGWSNPTSCATGSCLDIAVSFPAKTPIAGVDNSFYFGLTDSGIIPYGTEDASFRSLCNINSSHRENGRQCTAWVIYNENMDYLHCNDLSWDGKKKCK